MTTGAAPLLELDRIDAAYVRRRILEGVSLSVRGGEVVALLGPNGAGKSTVLRAAFGLARVTAGEVRFEGQPITGARPAENLRRGIAYLPQGGQVFRPLSVAENLRVAADRLSREVLDDRAMDRAYERFPVLAERRRQRAGSLSGGERQQLAIAMSLLGRPRVLLVDEPSIGLAPRLAREALATVAEIAKTLSAGVLLVEQNVSLALAVATRAVLLLGGCVAAMAATAAIREDELLQRQFTFGLEAATADCD